MAKKEQIPQPTTQTFDMNNVISTVLLLGFLAGFTYYGVAYLPYLLDQTTDAKEKRLAKDIESRTKNEANRKLERQKKLLSEDPTDLVFAGRTAVMKTNFGNLEIQVQDKAAPKTAESFIRLVNRKYYDNTDFHRMVKAENFSVIQGGDPLANGQGGESAFGTPLPDEIFTVKPTISQDEPTKGAVTNEPVFTDPTLYTGFDKSRGTVEYRKGLIIMANAGPDTGGSQFFITLDKTILPASYTIFGTISESSFSTLDKMKNEIGVIVTAKGTKGYESTTQDGKPDKELFIENITLK
jgi:cyclophilin family peptidyl-prolyl cis-trans isomerase